MLACCRSFPCPSWKHGLKPGRFFETIHSRSYTHIIRNIVNDPSVVFDDIVQNEYIIARAEDIACYYDDLIEYTQYFNLLGVGEHRVNGKTIVVSERELKKKTLPLPDVRERAGSHPLLRFLRLLVCLCRARTDGGQRQIIKLIARDEALHLTSTQHMLNLMRGGAEGAEWAEIAAELQNEWLRTLQKSRRARKRMGRISV